MIYIASDHAGFILKEKLKKKLKNKVIDLGPEKYDKNDDYSDYAKKLCKKIQNTNNRGILICGSGHGMTIAANRFKGIRATLCHSLLSAKYARTDTNSNVLCLPARLISERKALKITKVWLNTKFSDGSRHKRRLKKI